MMIKDKIYSHINLNISTGQSDISKLTENKNIFKSPERYPDQDFRNLLHCSKDQFFDCVRQLEEHIGNFNTDLSVYSITFIFRTKVLYFELIFDN